MSRQWASSEPSADVKTSNSNEEIKPDIISVDTQSEKKHVKTTLSVDAKRKLYLEPPPRPFKKAYHAGQIKNYEYTLTKMRESLIADNSNYGNNHPDGAPWYPNLGQTSSVSGASRYDPSLLNHPQHNDGSLDNLIQWSNIAANAEPNSPVLHMIQSMMQLAAENRYMYQESGNFTYPWMIPFTPVSSDYESSSEEGSMCEDMANEEIAASNQNQAISSDVENVDSAVNGGVWNSAMLPNNFYRPKSDVETSEQLMMSQNDAMMRARQMQESIHRAQIYEYLQHTGKNAVNPNENAFMHFLFNSMKASNFQQHGRILNNEDSHRNSETVVKLDSSVKSSRAGECVEKNKSDANITDVSTHTPERRSSLDHFEDPDDQVEPNENIVHESDSIPVPESDANILNPGHKADRNDDKIVGDSAIVETLQESVRSIPAMADVVCEENLGYRSPMFNNDVFRNNVQLLTCNYLITKNSLSTHQDGEESSGLSEKRKAVEYGLVSSDVCDGKSTKFRRVTGNDVEKVAFSSVESDESYPLIEDISTSDESLTEENKSSMDNVADVSTCVKELGTNDQENFLEVHTAIDFPKAFANDTSVV